MVGEHKAGDSAKSSRFDFIKDSSSEWRSSPSSSPKSYSGFPSRRPKYNVGLFNLDKFYFISTGFGNLICLVIAFLFLVKKLP